MCNLAIAHSVFIGDDVLGYAVRRQAFHNVCLLLFVQFYTSVVEAIDSLHDCSVCIKVIN